MAAVGTHPRTRTRHGPVAGQWATAEQQTVAATRATRHHGNIRGGMVSGMDTSAIVTAVIAGIGLLTTAGAPLLQTRAAARHERDAHLRTERMRLYAEAMVFQQGFAEYLAWLVGDVLYDRTRESMGAAREDITGRMWLLAPKPALDAWLRLVVAGQEVAFHESEVWQPDPGFDRVMPPRTDPVIVAAEQALEQVRVLLRAQVDAG